MKFLFKINLILFSFFGFLLNSHCSSPEMGNTLNVPSAGATSIGTTTGNKKTDPDPPLIVGAERTDLYLDELKGRKIGLIVNQTSTVNGSHLVDWLLAENISVQKIFAPEHGFRGTADAGQQIKNCLLYTSPSPRDATLSRMPSSA